ncbi:hypothetical protein HDU98_000067 [Podochytrium sp. JEL0797]|nr:hypothetical protein HDU98_000067 [Podochytrium sp. JEL0797]
MLFPTSDPFTNYFLSGVSYFFFMLRFLEMGTFDRCFTSKWTMQDYYQFLGVSDNEPIRRLVAKSPESQSSNPNRWKPKIAWPHDRTAGYYARESVRLAIVLVVLTWGHAYLEKYPYNSRGRSAMRFLMPWDWEGVLEAMAFACQLYGVIDLLYTMGTLMIVEIVRAPFTPPFDAPYFSTSLRDFWSNRWNQPIKITIHRISFVPTLTFLQSLDPSKESRPRNLAIATFTAFAMSALIHEYAIIMLIPQVYIPGENAAFFLMHGVACLVVERLTRGGGGGRGFGPVVGWFATCLFFLVTSPFFVGPYGRSETFLQVPVPSGLKEFFQSMM